jgi:hypothetical protein
MRRREFIAGCCASAAWPLAGRAQQQARTYRVGLLASRPIDEGEERRKAIKEVLAAHDFVEGRNLLFEPRWGDSLSENVEALKAARVDVIITFGYPAALAAKTSQRTCPSFALGRAIQLRLAWPKVWRDPAAI